MVLLHFRTPPRVRVSATVKLSAGFFHDESSITIEGLYENAIASNHPAWHGHNILKLLDFTRFSIHHK